MPHGPVTRPFTEVSAARIPRLLARRLIPVADRLRDLYTRFGLRPYTVRVIRTRWSGGERGVGEELVVSEMSILPTPLVSDLTSLTEIVQPIGLDEIGGIVVSQVSGRFTEDELLGYASDGTPPEADEQVFWEIEFPRVNEQGERRRFVIRSTPHYAAARFQWTVNLERAHEGRTRSGDLR